MKYYFRQFLVHFIYWYSGTKCLYELYKILISVLW